MNKLSGVALTREMAQSLDRDDPLVWLKQHFFVEGNNLYFDGNSLWRLPKEAQARVERFLREEWWIGLIDSREKRLNLSVELWDRLWTHILWAKSWETIISDNVTINLYKLLGSLFLNWTKTVITHQGNFPTDKYISDVMPTLFAGTESLRLEENFMHGVTVGDIQWQLERLGSKAKETVFLISHVDYRSWALADIKGINAAAHAAGAIVIWDFCHSAGVVPIDFDDNKCDFGVGCTYKYLNAWPGAPAFVAVAERHIPGLTSIIPGRRSQAPQDQFAFKDRHSPASDIRALQTGTPSILALQPLTASLDIYEKTNILQIRAKSEKIIAVTAKLLAQELADKGVEVITPQNADQRWSHISFTHTYAREIAIALRQNDVIPDFRPPNIVRIWIAPLYTSYEEVFDLVERLKRVIEWEEYVSVTSEAIVT